MTYISQTEGLISPAISMKCASLHYKVCLWYMFGVYANLICVICNNEVTFICGYKIVVKVGA